MADPEAHGGRTRPRRTVRDWAVDISAFLLAAFFGMVAADELARTPHISELLLAADQLLGAAACAALWLRRRWPVGLALALTAAGTFAHCAAGAMLVALFTVAVHRPFRTTTLVGGAALLCTPVQPWLRPDPGLSYLGSVVIGVLLVLLVFGWGMFVRAGRLVVLSLRERARRAETEAALRAEQAQRLARESVAREMHDVLAHRLTLLSVHAGALEFRRDAPPEEVALAAGIIRDSAHQALEDLREIIGVLRAPGGSLGDDRPQPTLAALERLVAESRQAGMKVVLDNRVGELAVAPAGLGRTTYRIAQEALTNARKHAPGAETTVLVAGGPGEGLTIEVRNGPPPSRPAERGSDAVRETGAGQGLYGLAERAHLAGGRFGHDRTEDGGFRVHAWLPWPT
ncbi:sensor histidine kinase [Streptomyces sp. GC420]|nr:sensor histidine kinase [Streptomyces sp. GC420]